MKEGILFVISGVIGTILFYILYEFLYRILTFEEYKSTICWCISYLLSIAWQHKLHLVIVFPNKKINNYFYSLFKTYLVYSFSLILSTFISFCFDLIHLEHTVSWVLTLTITGFLNYFTVKDYALS